MTSSISECSNSQDPIGETIEMQRLDQEPSFLKLTLQPIQTSEISQHIKGAEAQQELEQLSYVADLEKVIEKISQSMKEDPFFAHRVVERNEENDLLLLKLIVYLFPDVVTKKDVNGFTLLHTASGCGTHEMVDFLLHCKSDANNRLVDLNCRTKQMLTPLHIAVAKGNEKIAHLLVENGADRNLYDIVGFTAADWALFWSLENTDPIQKEKYRRMSESFAPKRKLLSHEKMLENLWIRKFLEEINHFSFQR